MPFIHIYAHSGKDQETKIKVAQDIVKVFSETIGAPESVFTVAFEDVQPEAWEKDVVQAIVEPLGDKVLIKRGKMV